MIARAGGKSQIAHQIISKAPPHKKYVEPFVGGGAVFLKKPLAEKSVINDKDKDVIKVFKAFKDGKGFNSCNMKPSKQKFDKAKKKKNKSACDVAYLNKLSFGSGMTTFALGKFMGKTPTGTYKKRFPTNKKDLGITYQKAHAKDYKEKLKNTTVINQDFAKVMQSHDSKDTFHYLDPPYVGSEKVYKENDSVSPEKVCKVAKKMKGKVMISYNDHPRVRKACKGMHMKRIQTRYTLSAKTNNQKAKELLITNYKTK